MRSLSVIPALLCSFAMSAQALSAPVVVLNSELPQTIRQSGAPVALFGADFGSVSIFQFVASNWLVRYDLTPPSGQTDINGNLTAAYDGYLWMQVQDSYSAASLAHAVTLYRDKVTPAPNNFFGQNDGRPYTDANGDLSLFVTTADLLAGHALRTIADPGFGDVDAGTLSGELPVPCLADGCQVHVELNFVQFAYQLSGTSVEFAGINSGDTRGLVYREGSGYLNASVPYYTEQTFAISAVPEPSVLAMLGCGLGLVAFAARRRRA